MDNPFVDQFPVVERDDIREFLDIEQELRDFYYLSPDNRFGAKLHDDLKDKPKFSLSHLRKTYARSVEYGVCPTLTANMGEGGHNIPFLIDHKGLRKLTEYECLKLQGFPEEYLVPDFESMTRARVYKMIGNSVSPRVSYLLSKQVFNFLDGHLNEDKLAV